MGRPAPLPSKAPTGSDARDISSFDGRVDHPGYAATPAKILQAFRLAEAGYPQLQCDLIDDLVENDGHLRNLFEQRERAVGGKPWVIQAGEQGAAAAQAADVMRTALRLLPLITVFEHLLTFNRYGWGCVEIDWGTMAVDGRIWIVPKFIATVEARRFRITTPMMGLDSSAALDSLRLLVDTGRPAGDELRAGKWIVLRRSASRIARAGLGRTCSWPAMGKRYGFRDLLVLSERFGMPLPIATYKEDAGDEEIDTAEAAVRQIGSDGGAVLPDTIKLEVKPGINADKPIQLGLISYCNREMSKAVNGSTLSNDNSDSGGASYALGDIHDAVRWDNVLYDAERLQEAFRTQLFAPFIEFNGLGCAPPLLKVQVVRDLDPVQRTNIAVRMVNELGIDVSVSQMREELGYREPTGPDDKSPGMKIQAFPVPAGGAPP